MIIHIINTFVRLESIIDKFDKSWEVFSFFTMSNVALATTKNDT